MPVFKEEKLFKSYAAMHGMTFSEFLRRCAYEHIDNEYDLKAFDTAMEAYRQHPVTYSLEEVERELDL